MLKTMTPKELVLAELSGAAFTVRTLLSELGLLKTATVFLDLARASTRGEPFGGLGPPVDEQDELSRRQLASAVLLYRALKDNLDQDQALALTGKIIEDASVDFLRLNVPVLRKKALLDMPGPERDAMFKSVGAKFFNADANIRMVDNKIVYFSVHRCRFVELLRRVGEPEMAVLFCKGDFRFFNEHQPDIALHRPQELSTGGAYCDFQFHLK